MYLSPFLPIRALSALLVAALAASCAPPVEEPLPGPKPVIPPVQDPPAQAETQAAPVHIILESLGETLEPLPSEINWDAVAKQIEENEKAGRVPKSPDGAPDA